MLKSELKIKITSLGAECTLIRHEENRRKKDARDARQKKLDDTEHVKSFWSLREHRLELKQEVRASILATRFLRGKAYATAEVDGSRKPLPWKRIQQIAKKFGEERFDQEAWLLWRTEAENHFDTCLSKLKAKDRQKSQPEVEAALAV